MILFSPFKTFSQTESNMLLPLIAGNQYELKHYDKKGRLESNRKLKIGKIQEKDQAIEVKIVAYNYNENPTPQDSVRTRLACGNSAEKMTMSLLAFLGNSGDGKLKLTITSREELFPADLSKNKKLRAVRMEVKFEEGVFSIFGAKSKITLRNRKLNLIKSEEPGNENVRWYKITSKLLIQAYALGINIKNFVYNVEEIVDLNKGLVSQVVREADGSYFELKLIEG